MRQTSRPGGTPFAAWVRWVVGCLMVGAWLSPMLAQEVPAWRLVWSDEFNLPHGSAPDPANWNYDVGGHGWGNQELQYHTDNRRANARVDGGFLIIEARQETYHADGRTYDYTSARLHTARKFETTYGRVEARIQIPTSRGIWPAFWMLGSRYYEVGWPDCGEIDIMENMGRQPATVHASLHGPEYYAGNAETESFTLPKGRFSDGFHLFALEWEPSRIRISVDNIVYLERTVRGLGPHKTWVFNAPFFIILNVAVGGVWAGSPDATTVFPQRMRVDYVRVYESITAPAPALTFETAGNQIALSWPARFPQARLQRADALDGPWEDVALDGVIAGDRFRAVATPGLYRLR